jgi:hypothetical protein
MNDPWGDAVEFVCFTGSWPDTKDQKLELLQGLDVAQWTLCQLFSSMIDASHKHREEIELDTPMGTRIY